MNSETERAAVAALEEARRLTDQARAAKGLRPIDEPNRPVVKAHNEPQYFGSNDPTSGMDIGAKSWANAFIKAWDKKTLTVSGDLVLDVEIGAFLKPGAPRYVAQICGRQVIDGATASWLRETAHTNNAAPVARGAAKPETALTLTRESADLQYLAHLVSGLSNADLQDESKLANVIGMKMREGISLELDDQIINGSGTAPALQGILDAGSNVATIAYATSVQTTIRKARTALLAANVDPSRIDLVMAPADVETLDLTTVTGGAYLFQGEGPVDANQDRLWGMRIIESPALAAGFAIAGDFGAAVKVFTTPQGVSVQADPYTGFTVNETTLRAEGRYAVGHPAPDRLRIIDLTV